MAANAPTTIPAPTMTPMMANGRRLVRGAEVAARGVIT
jgi:hypothetical protein